MTKNVIKNFKSYFYGSIIFVSHLLIHLPPTLIQINVFCITIFAIVVIKKRAFYAVERLYLFSFIISYSLSVRNLPATQKKKKYIHTHTQTSALSPGNYQVYTLANSKRYQQRDIVK